MAFDLTVTSLFSPLLQGQRLVLLGEGLGADKLSEALQVESDLAFVKLTPAHLRMLRELIPAEKIKGRVRVLVIGGEALRLENLKFWRDNDPGTKIFNEYGPTETVVGSCVYEVPGDAGNSGEVLIGRPIANTQIWVLDRRMQPVPKGVAGEIYIGGEGVARGYWGRAELTAERFVPNPFAVGKGERMYRTGDRGRHGSDGELEFLGRMDEQVKIRGYRVELGEIEGVMKEQVGVEEAVVVMQERGGGEKRLVGYWVKGGGRPGTSASEMRQWLQQKLPEYMVPAVVMELAEMPLTGNGKIDRKGLPDPEKVRGRERVRARTAVEEVVAGVWSEVLKQEETVGVEDNFFELGGHSLLATRVVSRLRSALQVEVTLPMLFDAPTVAGLALQVERVQREQQGLVAPPMVAVPRNGRLPLSFAQQRLWFMDQLYPEASIYNGTSAIRLHGVLEREVLQKAVNQIVERHEVLRTSFPAVQGEPVQMIGVGMEIGIETVDLRGKGEREQEAEIRWWMEEEGRKRFDLRQGPLLRLRLLRLSEGEHILVCSMHHIVTDGWSLGIMVRELSELYAGIREGRGWVLPRLELQYVDFAHWQREWLQGEVLEGELRYWRRQLTDAPEELELVPGRARAGGSFRGGMCHFTVGREVCEPLRRLARREQVTLFMVLLGAWEVLLLRYSGQEDMMIGTPIANRNRVETENLIGFFVNLLVLRSDVGGNPKFVELLGRVREKVLGAYAHQDLPFEKLVAELQPERSLKETPLFRVMFT
jgi:acyl carrier protein